MALNDIRLNSTLLADMYRNCLIDNGHELHDKSGTLDVPIKKRPTSQAKDWPYIGGFKKNILLIVRDDRSADPPAEAVTFLNSVLAACKLSIADVALLNLAYAPAGVYRPVLERFRSSVVILFGITPQEFELPVDFPEFQVQSFNHCTFLHTPGLGRMETDKVLKSKLWVCLKKIFEI